MRKGFIRKVCNSLRPQFERVVDNKGGQIISRFWLLMYCYVAKFAKFHSKLRYFRCLKFTSQNVRELLQAPVGLNTKGFDLYFIQVIFFISILCTLFICSLWGKVGQWAHARISGEEFVLAKLLMTNNFYVTNSCN